jgi:undecaprenyl-diphosphatase
MLSAIAALDRSAFLAINGAFAADPVRALFARFMAHDAIEVLALVAALLAVSGVAGRWRKEAGAMLEANAAAVRGGVAAFAAGALAWFVNNAFAILWFRPRPMIDIAAARILVDVDTAQKSFPSDHAGISFAIAWSLWKYDRRVGAFALPLAALIAFGRVAAGVHYPTDVVAGALVGVLSAECAYRVLSHPRILKLSRSLCSSPRHGSSA